FAHYTDDHADEPLRVRVGLHSGEVLRESDDFFGRNVIMAARIASRARGCEILVSDDVARAVRDLDGIMLDDGRDLELKGLAGRRTAGSGRDACASRSSTPRTTASAPRSTSGRSTSTGNG